MRLVLSAFLALALGLLPVGAARAQNAPAAPSMSAMSCNDQGGALHDMGGDETPNDDSRERTRARRK